MSYVDTIILFVFCSSFIYLTLNYYNSASSSKNYFLADKNITWKKSMFSVVATETSLLTFMSLPGIGYRGENLFFLQLALGYIFGRILSANYLLPMYYKTEIISIYELIGKKFGKLIQKVASLIFLLTRLLADGVRFLLTAIVIQKILNIPIEICIITLGLITLIYSVVGGVKAIINIDSIQFFIYIFGGLFSIFYILNHLDINFMSSFYNFLNQDIIKTQISSKGIIFDSYFFVNAFIGGTLLSLCSHGVDYMMVQRALCTKDLKSAQKSIIGSGFLVFAQFLIFLFVGFLLAKFYTNSGVVFEKDREFAHFIISDLPIGIKGILIAGVFSAAMSTLSSSINSLTSSTFIDFNIKFDNIKKIFIGLFWSVALTSIALIFDESNEALIITGIKIASFTYGILLTYFILLKLNLKLSSLSIIIGNVFGLITVYFCSFYGVAWTLLIMICCLINMIISILINYLQKLLK